MSDKELFEKLQAKLLLIGGKLVSERSDPHWAEVLMHGKTFEQPVCKVGGDPNNCHENASRLWAEDVKKHVLVTGYALHCERWRPHSWVLRGGEICDSCEVESDHYFGWAMDPLRAIQFWTTNLLQHQHPDLGQAAHFIRAQKPELRGLLTLALEKHKQEEPTTT